MDNQRPQDELRASPIVIAGVVSQMGEINSWRWISEKDGVVRIPIDRAMELVVEEEARKRDR